MLRSGIVALFLLLGAAGAWSDPSAPPGELGYDDVHAVRAVVEGQLEALAADDAERALNFAVPEVRAQFGDASHFAAMVHNSYPMLIRPQSISFFRPELVDGAVMQAVQFHDSDGRVWRAIYELERQADAGWRIAACVIRADDDAMTT